MNKQEAIEKVKEHGDYYSNAFGGTVKMVPVGPVIDTISQIDEPQKVVVPKFVAEWIEYCKHDKFYALHGAYRNMDDEMKYWRFIGNNSDIFAKAWLDGYEIEQEQLYTVEIADAILTKITRGRNVQYKMLPSKDVSDVFDKGIYATRLTETEIKQKDERLWQWAVPVEEN